MSEAPERPASQTTGNASRIREVRSALSSTPKPVEADRVLCDRCGAEVYRMHAVWRCPACGFKSDCCGW